MRHTIVTSVAFSRAPSVALSRRLFLSLDAVPHSAPLQRMRCVFLLLLLHLLATLVTADRVHLPHDYRDERLDDDDDALQREESIDYFSSRRFHGADGGSRGWIEKISDSPRAYVFREFLTDAECDRVIERAYPTMEASEVTDDDSGEARPDDARSSIGGWVSGDDDEVIRNIELRASTWAMLPMNRGETMQVLRYEKGQKYDAHDDFFHDEHNVKNGGQRVATILMYLSDVEEGGETVFPLGTPLGGRDPEKSGVTGDNACELASQNDPRVLAVKPRRGDALLFFNAHLSGEMDEKANHAGCPVNRGTKWTMTRWHRVGAIGVGTFASDPKATSDSEQPHAPAGEP